MENSAQAVVDQEPKTEVSSTPTRSWSEVASVIWEKRRLAPRYPRALTVNEILAQMNSAFNDQTPERVLGIDGNEVKETREVPRGTGLLMRLTQLDSDKIFPFPSQFEVFVRKMSRITDNGFTPWPSWKHAWVDFAEYAGLNTLAHKTARLKEGFSA